MYSVQDDSNQQQQLLQQQQKQQQDLHRKKLSISSVASSAVTSNQGLKRTRKKDTIEMILSRPPMIVKSSLSQLRYHILVDGLKVPKDSEDGLCPYRPYVWSVLLRAPPQSSSEYIELVNKGPCAVYTKIRNDTFRTLTTDAKFQKRVSENALIRVLNSFAWKQLITHYSNSQQAAEEADRRMSTSSSINYLSSSINNSGQNYNNNNNNNINNPSYLNQDFLYVQGMNVIVAPFLYTCKAEPQAFTLFETFLSRDCPLYIRPTLEGVHTGLMLMDACLEIIDPVLFDSLRKKYLSAELYAFASVLTFSACTPPLSEVLVLWDFLFAYGPHLNILFVIAQLNLIRGQLLESKSPISLLRSFPPLRAKEIIKLGISFVALLPKHLYDLLKRHPYDESVHGQIKKTVSTAQNLQKFSKSSSDVGSLKRRPKEMI